MDPNTLKDWIVENAKNPTVWTSLSTIILVIYSLWLNYQDSVRKRREAEIFYKRFMSTVNMTHELHNDIVVKKNEYMERCMDNTERLIDDYVTNTVIASYKAWCRRINIDNNLIKLYSAEMKSIVVEGFRAVKRNVRTRVRQNGFSNRSEIEFKTICRDMTEEDSHVVIRTLREHYDDSYMPIPLQERLDAIDYTIVLQLGERIYGFIREQHRKLETELVKLDEVNARKIDELVQSFSRL